MHLYNVHVHVQTRFFSSKRDNYDHFTSFFRKESHYFKLGFDACTLFLHRYSFKHSLPVQTPGNSLNNNLFEIWIPGHPSSTDQQQGKIRALETTALFKVVHCTCTQSHTCTKI